ncbi:probable peptide chain release factor C12orf65, mitochondrial isoform X3 [Fopius arisanus]|uniref:Probable peptide chain release factor C12orf65, mitochondrial isoform X3 n=1 Tax=Fopius arisanus TaxID=64838 RepID=A0A9R1TYB9_9HYME|nr:PREDICTED: probable peptide chain release factor C12orf65, mitochondrial isoform X3 [Fopius arisanus]
MMLNRFLIVQLRFKSLKKFLDFSRVPKLNENDLEEQYVRGSGPGGQATNKTNNAVVLKHKPSGIVVKCHQSRSLWDNKKTAREILVMRLDSKLNGEFSIENQERKLLSKQSADRTRKRNKLLQLKNEFKEREGLN